MSSLDTNDKTYEIWVAFLSHLLNDKSELRDAVSSETYRLPAEGFSLRAFHLTREGIIDLPERKSVNAQVSLFNENVTSRPPFSGTAKRL